MHRANKRECVLTKKSFHKSHASEHSWIQLWKFIIFTPNWGGTTFGISFSQTKKRSNYSLSVTLTKKEAFIASHILFYLKFFTSCTNTQLSQEPTLWKKPQSSRWAKGRPICVKDLTSAILSLQRERLKCMMEESNNQGVITALSRPESSAPVHARPRWVLLYLTSAKRNQRYHIVEIKEIENTSWIKIKLLKSIVADPESYTPMV